MAGNGCSTLVGNDLTPTTTAAVDKYGVARFAVLSACCTAGVFAGVRV